MKGWYKASGTNICYITFAYANRSRSKMNFLVLLREIVISKRLEFVAKHTCDFLTKIREKCIKYKQCSLQSINDIVAVGFSIGAHIGAMTSRCLYQRTCERFGKIFGKSNHILHKNYPFN